MLASATIAGDVGNGDWMRTVVATVGMLGVVTSFMPDTVPVVETPALVAVCRRTGCKAESQRVKSKWNTKFS